MHIETLARVADVMTREVATVAPATPVKEIARVLAQRRVSALPVVDLEGRVVGVVSEADLLLKEGRGALADPPRRFEAASRRAQRAKAGATVAAELMTAPALTIAPEASVADAARLMRERGVKRLVVVDDHDRLAGIITRCCVEDPPYIKEAKIERIDLRRLYAAQTQLVCKIRRKRHAAAIGRDRVEPRGRALQKEDRRHDDRVGL